MKIHSNYQQVEYDNLFIGDMAVSVGTKIKVAAVELHKKFIKQKNSLSPPQRKIMSNGLSSILDLVDISLQGQRSLFSSTDWDEIERYFISKLPTSPTTIESVLADNWKVVYSTVKKSDNLNTGLSYLFKAYPRYLSTSSFSLLRIYEHTLELLKNYPHLLSKKSPQNCTEGDFLSLVWTRYFELLFNSTCVRVKRGESTASNSNENKNELYPNKDNVISFKIDIRFVVDHNGKEYDVACGEVAKHDGSQKIIDDEGKLCREGKDIVDNLLVNLPFELCKQCIEWTVQLAGASCLISSVHLSENGLYVYEPRGDFLLPSNIDALAEFKTKVMPVLLLLKSKVASYEEYGFKIVKDGFYSKVTDSVWSHSLHCI